MTLQQLLARLQDLQTHGEGLLTYDKPVLVRGSTGQLGLFNVVRGAYYDADIGRYVLEVEGA